jgi:TfoX N-terminal domain
MAADEGLVQRIREALGPEDVAEKRMFGGVAFLSRSYMFVGVSGDTLMARIGPDRYAEALTLPHVREMDFTGRPMKGYVFVDPPGIERDEDLNHWIALSLAFVRTLPDR